MTSPSPISRHDGAAFNADNWGLAWRLARREMRGSLTKFRVFLSALLLGVAAIGAVGSVADAMRGGIAGNAKLLLGGDMELSSRHTQIDAPLGEALAELGSRSDVLEMRAMLGNLSGERKLVELKAVDQMWPLVGTAEIVASLADDAPPLSVAEAFADNGVVAGGALLRSLNLDVGDRVRLGDSEVRIGGVLVREPDSAISFVGFGPRVLMMADTLGETGLRQPSSFITYRTRILLDNPENREAVLARFQAATKDSHIRVRGLTGAATGFDTFIGRAEVFLVLVGLTALLIGGLGVSGAVRAWMTSRMPIIATLTCLGAPARLIFRIYLLQIMSIAFIGVLGGLTLAMLAPLIAADLLSSYVSVPLAVRVYPEPLLIAGSFGLLTAFIFAVWPLAKSEEVKAGHLFRAMITPPPGLVRPVILLAMCIAAAGLVGLALMATRDWRLTAGFIGGAAVSLFILSVLGETVLRIMRRLPAPSYVPARIALSGITRNSSPLRAIIIAFGLGLSVLVAVTVTRANLDNQISSRVAQQAPDWFFIDIQPEQMPVIEKLAAENTGITALQRTPSLRGRVTAINDIPASALNPPEESRWIIRGDRVITWADSAPDGTNIVAGSWWPEGYTGTPQISVSEDMFTDFGLALGDTITLNVLGREITTEIGSVRAVEWESFQINFVFILSANALAGAPHSWVAAAYAETEADAEALEQAITAQFPNVSAISVKEAVSRATEVIDLLGAAIRMTAIVTMISGIAVLAGTVANSESQRLSDSIILKVLGATRKDILLAWLMEYALLGLLTALVASFIGSLAAWGVISGFLRADFYADPAVVATTAFAGAAMTMLLGLAGAIRSLGHKAGPHLREIV